jgi:hypothetical protein
MRGDRHLSQVAERFARTLAEEQPARDAEWIGDETLYLLALRGFHDARSRLVESERELARALEDTRRAKRHAEAWCVEVERMAVRVDEHRAARRRAAWERERAIERARAERDEGAELPEDIEADDLW